MKMRNGIRSWSNMPGWCWISIPKSKLPRDIELAFRDAKDIVNADENDEITFYVKFISFGTDDPGVTSAPADFCREPYREETRVITSVYFEDRQIDERSCGTVGFASVAYSIQDVVNRATGHFNLN